MPRPATGQTPIRHVRISDALWERIGQVAEAQDRSRSEVVLEALTWYLSAAQHVPPSGRWQQDAGASRPSRRKTSG